MRFYKILFSLLLMFLIACHREAAPDNLIEEDQFVPLLVDIHLADGYLSTGSQMPDSLSYRGNGLYAAIFKKHHVDSVQFKKSYQYYSVHLEQMGQIYKAVTERLTAKNDSLTKIQNALAIKKSKHVTDSLAKVAKINAAKIDSARKKSLKRDSTTKPKKAVVKKASKNIVDHK
ncbi:DUF4296 domain-containing protein [Mucilaginibacter arboris]|uniref:DUF4296 domain-containing protein n=1 Tax=Mucilaginibacter arboris TaxID=2682090 RepID=A0A7K1SZJ5_9SPHI|nr:DUF4296 domain-containing protein [Mucilaginibacter arboris]MVN22470.1 DUF4296 domain-containing protein [Mucilaginibacter arboris]